MAVVEIAPRAGLVNERFLPPFSTMISSLVDQAGTPEFWRALLETVRGWALGLAIAMAAGVVLGIVIGAVPLLRSATVGAIEFLRPIPSVALIPLAVLLYGTQMRATLLLVVYASFWQVLVQVLYGVRDVDPVARETARSYRFRPLTRVRTVLWPTALPYVMTGFRLGAAVALILEITGELVIGSPGLGRQIAVAQTSGAVDAMYALVIVVGVMGVAVNTAARATERRVLRWHPSVRGEVPA
ncbi:ABC transporter permease [Actinomadura barringtoniae]|uniref:ABC transporter permease n=2 Tax=Actinomadura barringtoniae TaxID=1427535 RepID=A0A939T2S8_9ACTN|nr:ABC transporter permease [Actinomadura barringtoniae]